MNEQNAGTHENGCTWTYLGCGGFFLMLILLFLPQFRQLLGMVTLLALMMLIPLLGLLATMSVANFVTSRPNRKRKPFAPLTIPSELIDPEADYTLDSDGELLPLPKSKLKHEKRY